MKTFRRFVGHQLCPRCKEKKLKMTLWGKIRKDGSYPRATLTIAPDSNPACMWDGEEYSLTDEQAKKIIAAAELRDSLAARSVETNQPSLFG
jgi:hypothetical protein